jgi:ssDNA-binding Zn-finger/Zn-ribbon topoisomerase 1
MPSEAARAKELAGLTQLDRWHDAGIDCPRCGSPLVLERMHEDSEGHEDWEYLCGDPECNYRWWVDGIDS